MKKIKLTIKGMHCTSCELLLEDALSQVSHVEKTKVDHQKGYAEIYYTNQKPKLEDLENVIVRAGYAIGETETPNFFSRNKEDYRDLFWGGVLVFVVYQLIRLLGISDFVNFDFEKSNVGFWVALLVGLVAGFSSCMALIGGLVLGFSARYAETHPKATPVQKFQPHLYFNLGRIGGYGILGGILGLVGSTLQLSVSFTSFLTLCAGVVMLYIGFQLIGIFPRLNSWSFTLPKSMARMFGITTQKAEYSHRNSMLMGALTFFLPCGFTQSMQVYAISSGNFISGAMIMGFFALGTAPGLLTIGGLTSFLKGHIMKKILKTIGIVVVLFGILNVSNGLTLLGIHFPKNTDKTNSKNEEKSVEVLDGVQIVKMEQRSNGYFPNSFVLTKGTPVRWIIFSDGSYSCASNIVVRKLGINKYLVKGENVIEFTPTEKGDIPFSCGMGMYTGVFHVIEGTSDPFSVPNENSGVQKPTYFSCNSSCGTFCGGRCGANLGRIDQPMPFNDSVETQRLKSVYTNQEDIQPNSFRVKNGIPVEYVVDIKENGLGCMSTIKIRGLYEPAHVLRAGNTITMRFVPKEKGQYPITCAMGVVRGKIIVE